jgi:hypothetical protein
MTIFKASFLPPTMECDVAALIFLPSSVTIVLNRPGFAGGYLG